ncbi:MAG TPA: YbaK/EbsC family protein [Patescibacteria group bacterium]|nr:YbaK/EbsC family protein [Patescibacteria group bacterium]
MPKKKTLRRIAASRRAKKKANKPVSKKIKKLSTPVTRLLDEAKIKYKVIEHKVVYTAHDAAQTAKKKLNEIAKVVLVKADKDFVLIVLPAGKYVDLAGVKKTLKAKTVSLAAERDIAKYLKMKVGLLHPFGNKYSIATLLDRGLARAQKMIVSAGTYTDSVELAVKDFDRLIKPLYGTFGKAKR